MVEIDVVITGIDEGGAASLVKGRKVISPPAYALFYPLYAFRFHASLKRPFFNPREVDLFVVVDAARGGAYLADTFPEVEPVRVKEAYLLEGTVTREEARGRALEKAKRRLSFRYHESAPSTHPFGSKTYPKTPWELASRSSLGRRR